MGVICHSSIQVAGEIQYICYNITVMVARLMQKPSRASILSCDPLIVFGAQRNDELTIIVWSNAWDGWFASFAR